MKYLGLLLIALSGVLDSSVVSAQVLVESSCVTNPANIVPGTGLAQGRKNGDGIIAACGGWYCPTASGITKNGDVCTHNATGQKFTGWEILSVEVPNSQGCGGAPGHGDDHVIQLRVDNSTNSNCSGLDCLSPTVTQVFTGVPNGLGWTFTHRTTLTTNASTDATYTIYFDGLEDIDVVLVARGDISVNRSDPNWDDLKFYCNGSPH